MTETSTPPPSTVTFQFSHSVGSGGSALYDWSDPANWSDGMVPNSGNAVVIPPGPKGGISMDDIPSLTVGSLTLLPTSTTLRIGANDVLTVTGSVGNGVIRLDLGAELLELSSGYSYVDLSGNDSLLLQGGAPAGYLEFSTTAGNTGADFIESPVAPIYGVPGTDSQMITNFAAGDNIYIKETATGPLTVSYTPTGAGNGTLLIDEGGTPLYRFTNFHGSSTLPYQVAATTVLDPSTGTAVNAIDLFVCFAAGTRIATPEGERTVETLAEGDFVLVAEAGDYRAKRVRWVGHRRLDLAAHPRPELAAPIRFRAGSLGDNAPVRDLLVSPDHAMLIDGQLIPAKLMVNGMSIARESALPTVTYYHVELDTHSILLAEGVPTESYLDTGNRGFFANSGQPLALHPDLCAPISRAPAEVEPIWRCLAERARAIGFIAPASPTSTEAGLHLLADGVAVHGIAGSDGWYRFTVPHGAGALRLVSRDFLPADASPWLDDFRRLGVAVSRIRIEGREIALDDPALVRGWHAVERAEASIWRWTDGDAELPIDGEAGGVVEIRIQATGLYPIETERRLAA